jgi:predicted ribosome quality control (RQC) complex YloA/Tae2 family protein
MENYNSKNEEKNPLKKWVILLGVLSFVFLLTTLYFGFFSKPVFNQQYIQTVQEKDNLQSELDSLLNEHNKIKQEYGELSDQLTEKDSVILANAAEIKKLINSQADYRKIKKQMARLQNIAQEYVTEIDQLYTENKRLKEENTEVKTKLAETKVEAANLQQDKENLNKKINTAAVLKAYNIYARPIYFKRKGEEIITEKASRVTQIKTTFILSENSLIPAGPVNIYCRIAIPETGRVLTPGSGDAFSFNYQDQKLQYSVKKTINYNGSAETVALAWDLKEKDKAIKGRYIIQIYTDNQLLGESTFELK